MKDKQNMEGLIRTKSGDRKGRAHKGGLIGENNYLEMENKYLKDIKDLNDSFDEYKKHVEKHIL
jgi:hypothetical protein